MVEKFKYVYTWINIVIVFCSWLVLLYMTYILFSSVVEISNAQATLYTVGIIITIIFHMHLYALVYEKN